MSKLFVGIALVAATFGAPVLSFAQSSAPITRAEVRADLVRVEQAGYVPSANDINYPADIQAAESKIAAQSDSRMTNDAVGGVTQTGTSASGAPRHMAMSSSCVGPVSFCNVFFGS
ncbi:DUF4148 domain-containing protein [Paraburkholderia sp. BCC1886]|uniref:DUF4148 domain-containing protein n=1 Tax=Paraburkholderia sp. BCC1886 TaxID=2562670 RepID=UPI0011846386|nr:DUF4148 domain-containing protein [Paraburkholderia sp. BCC1886]